MPACLSGSFWWKQSHLRVTEVSNGWPSLVLFLFGCFSFKAPQSQHELAYKALHHWLKGGLPCTMHPFSAVVCHRALVEPQPLMADLLSSGELHETGEIGE